MDIVYSYTSMNTIISLIYDKMLSNHVYKKIYFLKNYLYSTKPLPDNNFCLNDCRCGGKFDLVLSGSCLILGLCLLECNLDFINVLGIYNI